MFNFRDFRPLMLMESKKICSFTKIKRSNVPKVNLELKTTTGSSFFVLEKMDETNVSEFYLNEEKPKLINEDEIQSMDFSNNDMIGSPSKNIKSSKIKRGKS